MKCLSTEDVFGSDDILIDRKVDNHPQEQLRWNGANKGQYHYFYHQYSNFTDSFTITVHEEDAFINDYIGSFTISPEHVNIEDQYIRLDPWGFGDYEIYWTNLTPHYEMIKNKHNEHNNMDTSKFPSETMEEYVNHHRQDYENSHKKLKEHFSQENRQRKTYEAVLKTIKLFKITTNEDERCRVVNELKETVGINPFRGIMAGIEIERWPTMIFYGMFSPINFGFADLASSYGVAVQTDGCQAAIVFSFGADIGITAGDEARMAIGINRNSLPDVAGFTYSYTIPSYDQLAGGMTFNFDLKLEAPDLQEVDYSFSPLHLPAGHSVGLDYTAVIYKPQQ